MCGQLDGVHAPVVARAEALLDHGRDELGRGEDGVLGLVPPRALDLAEVIVLDGLEDEVGHGVVRDGEILVLVLHLQRDLAQLREPLLHPVLVPGGVVAEHQVQTRLEVTLVVEEVDIDIFTRNNNQRIILCICLTCSDMIHSKEEQASLYCPIFTKRIPMLCMILIRRVLWVLGTWTFRMFHMNPHQNPGHQYLVQSHSIILDRLVVLPRLKIDVSHIDFQLARVIEHSVLGDHLRKQSKIILINKSIWCTPDRVGVECLGVHLVVVVLAGQVEQHAEGQVQVVRLAQSRLVPQSAQGEIFYGL